MKWNKKFEYPASIRSSVEGKRHYEITGQKLPSVTTILSATQSAEKKAKLAEKEAKKAAAREFAIKKKQEEEAKKKAEEEAK